MNLKVKFHDDEFSICKLDSLEGLDMNAQPFFLAKTRDELSLICKTSDVPANATANHGWRAFRLEDVLNFSLVGILSSITAVLASNGICIMAISTYDTDYILVKRDKVEIAKEALSSAGYTILP